LRAAHLSRFSLWLLVDEFKIVSNPGTIGLLNISTFLLQLLCVNPIVMDLSFHMEKELYNSHRRIELFDVDIPRRSLNLYFLPELASTHTESFSSITISIFLTSLLLS
jgi:hypothetical protein